MATPEEIAAVIMQRARLEPEVRGADLGLAVKRAVPSANLKDYGGLRRFIEQFCEDKLRLVRKHGLDDVYASADYTALEKTEIASTVGVWQAVTNPTSKFSAFVSSVDGTLTVLPNCEEPPSGLDPLPKITVEEHRDIAGEFLSELDSVDQTSFQQALKTYNWHAWARQINTYEHGKYRTKWLVFRQDRIGNLLKNRLLALGLDSPIAESTLKKIKDSKGPVVSRLAIGSNAGRLRVHVKRDSRENDIKRLAHQAIDLMSEEDVRKLKISLGVVIDALRTRQP